MLNALIVHTFTQYTPNLLPYYTSMLSQYSPNALPVHKSLSYLMHSRYTITHPVHS